jgi:hypothetical protein
MLTLGKISIGLPTRRNTENMPHVIRAASISKTINLTVSVFLFMVIFSSVTANNNARLTFLFFAAAIFDFYSANPQKAQRN